MTMSTFASLLETWEKNAQENAGKVAREVSLYETDDLKVRALATMYSLPVIIFQLRFI